MTSRPVVAIVPFGAKGRDAKAGGIGRQVARRLVERFADDPNVELRPVFLVAMPEAKSDAGYLVFGSTPDPDLAARYGESLGTTHALTGLYREDATGRAFAVSLVEVKFRTVAAERKIVVAPDELHRAEPTLAAWLAEALGVPAPGLAPETANEPSYQAFLAGLEDETNATLLRAGDPSAADQARARAFDEYADAVKLEPESVRAEDRLLVLAAESVERGDEDRAARSLEDVVDAKPRSWRAHYVRAELLRRLGETNLAIVALEHAHALRPLRDVDIVVLAELYISEQAPGQAAAHLRRIAAGSEEFGRAQELLGILALGKGDPSAARRHFERAAENGRVSARAHLARVLIADGRRDEAARELEGLLSTSGADALGLLARAASLRPREAAYIADAGFAHLQAGDLGAARERLRIASTIDAHDPLTRAYLAELERVEAESGKAN